MIRRIIKIDEKKCNGCGACASACHEGAIAMVDGKARLIRDDYCDGLGDCLPACLTGAIRFEEREAAAYDEKAVQAKMAENKLKAALAKLRGSQEVSPAPGCPGMQSRALRENQESVSPRHPFPGKTGASLESRLAQWPVQIKLAPVQAPYFDGADLLIAADCTAYAYGNFHNDFIDGRVTLIGCPKLDMTDYAEKLTEIIRENDIRSLTVARMQVPCCGGIEQAVKRALQDSGKFIPWQVYTIGMNGEILR